MRNLKIFTKNIEFEVVNQINTLMNQPAFKDCKVRIMPDVHAGAGCVIGFTADLGDKVIPNIVGVDIGCGMLTTCLGDADIDFEKLDNVIRSKIPSGREIHEKSIVSFDTIKNLRCYDKLKNTDRFERSIGTLGGGNHFIEVDVDVSPIGNGFKYLIIHTGSRNMGKQVAEYYQKLAVDSIFGNYRLHEMQEQLIVEYKAQHRENEIQSAIQELKRGFKHDTYGISKELCFLTGSLRDDYLHDMSICQQLASLNRATIKDIILSEMELGGYHSFETVHNYIEFDSNIVRKGAISAKGGELLLIPINMRDGCIIGIGKGNADWNYSAPHGAGRIMSRNKARETISLDEFKKSMDGIFTTSVSESTIDESPMAYKPIDEIVSNIRDTVRIIKVIKPIYNFKAGE